MAISVRASGTWAATTTQNVATTIPGGYSAGDLGILVAAWVPYNVTATIDQSWTEIIDETPGSTANGVGVGSSRVYVAWKILGSSETNPTLTRSGAITPAGSVIIVLQKASTEGWDIAKLANSVEQAMGSTAMSHTLTTTGFININQLVFALTGVADDTATFTRATTAISGGPSWGANVVEYPATHLSSTTGNDMAADLIYRVASTGVASGQTITVTATLAAAERVASVLFGVRAVPTFTVNAVIKRTQQGSKPFVRSVGTAASGTTSLTMTIPSSQDGDLLLMVVEAYSSTNFFDNYSDGPTTNGYPWYGPGIEASTGTGVATTDTWQYVWTTRKGSHGGTETTAVINFGTATDHVYGVILAIGGVGGTPYNAQNDGNNYDTYEWGFGNISYAYNWSDSNTTSISSLYTAEGATEEIHYNDNELLVYIVSNPADASTARFSNWAPISLTNSGYLDNALTEQFDLGTTTGNGGGIGIVTAYPSLANPSIVDGYQQFSLTGIQATQATSTTYAFSAITFLGLTFNAWIRNPTQYSSFTADAVILGPGSWSGETFWNYITPVTLTADAVIKVPMFTADAFIFGSGPRIVQNTVFKLSEYMASSAVVSETLYPSYVEISAGSPTVLNPDQGRFPDGGYLSFSPSAINDAISLVFDEDIWGRAKDRAKDHISALELRIGWRVLATNVTAYYRIAIYNESNTLLRTVAYTINGTKLASGVMDATADIMLAPNTQWTNKLKIRVTAYNSASGTLGIDYVEIVRRSIPGIRDGRISKIPVPLDQPTQPGNLIYAYMVEEDGTIPRLENTSPTESGAAGTYISGTGLEGQAADFVDRGDVRAWTGSPSHSLDKVWLRWSRYDGLDYLTSGELHVVEIENVLEWAVQTSIYAPITRSHGASVQFAALSSGPTMRFTAGSVGVAANDSNYYDAWWVSTEDAGARFTRTGGSGRYLTFEVESHNYSNTPPASNYIDFGLEGYLPAPPSYTNGQVHTWRGKALVARGAQDVFSPPVRTFTAYAEVRTPHGGLIAVNAIIKRVQGKTFDSQITGAVGWWKFDERPSATYDDPSQVTDYGSAGAHLNVFNSTDHEPYMGQAWASPPDPRMGNRGAISDDGNGGVRISRADVVSYLPNGNAARTFEFWHKGSTDSINSTVFEYGSYLTTGEFGFMFSNSSTGSWVRCIIQGPAETVSWGSGHTNNGYLADKKWHHFAITYSARNFELFVDGVSQGVRSISSDLNTNTNFPAGNWFIGCTHWEGWADFNNGAISNLVAYAGVLDRNVIAEHAASSEWLFFTLDAKIIRGFRLDARIGRWFTADATFVAGVSGPTGSFTASAAIKGTRTGSTTANAILKRTQTGSFTAAATLRRTYAFSFTAAAILKRNQTGSTTANAILKKTATGSFTANAVLASAMVTQTGSFTANAVLKLTRAGSFTANAALKKTATGSFTAAATIKRTASSTFTAAAIVKRTASSSLTASAWVQKTNTGSLTANAIVKVTDLNTTTANAILKRSQAGSFTAAALVKSSSSGSFTAASIIKRSTSGTFTASAWVQKTYSGSLTAAAILKATGSGSFTAAALVYRSTAGTFGANAVLKATRTASFATNAVLARSLSGSTTVYAWLIRVPAATFAANAVVKTSSSGATTAYSIVKATAAGAITANAVVKGTVSRTVTANAVVKASRTGAFTTSAWVQKTNAGSFSASAIIKATGTGLFGAYSAIYGATTFTIGARAVIIRTQSASTTANAVVVRTGVAGNFSASAWVIRVPTASFAANAVVKGTTGGSTTANAIVRGSAAGTLTANAVIRATAASSLTVNAIVSRAISSTFSASSWVQRTASTSFTAASVLRVTKTGSFAASALILSPRASSTTANAVIKTTRSGTAWMADAIVLGHLSGSFASAAVITRSTSFTTTANAVILRTASGSVTADAVLRGQQAGSFAANATLSWTRVSGLTADATKRATVASSITSNAITKATASRTLGVDAVLRRAQTAAITADAVLRSGSVGSFSAAAILQRSATSSFTANATFRVVRASGITANAAIRATVPGSLSANAWKSGTFLAGAWLAGRIQVDAFILAGSSGFFNAYGWVAGPYFGTFSSDSVFRRTSSASFTGNAAIVRTQASSFTGNAVVRRTATGTLTAHTVILREQQGSLTTNAIVLRSGAGSFSAAALVAGAGTSVFSANAVIKGIRSASVLADAIVQRGASATFTASAVVTVPRLGSLLSDATLLRTIGGSTTANAWLISPFGNVGTFTANAIKSVSAQGQLTADARIIVQTTGAGAFVADAQIRSLQSLTFTANASIRSTRTSAFSASAIASGSSSATFLVEASIRLVASSTFTVDAVQQKTSQVATTADAVLAKARTDGFVADAVRLSASTGTITADAVVIPAQLAFTASAWLLSKAAGQFTVDASISGVIPDFISATWWAGTIAATSTGRTIAATSSAATLAATSSYAGIGAATEATTLDHTRARDTRRGVISVGAVIGDTRHGATSVDAVIG